MAKWTSESQTFFTYWYTKDDGSPAPSGKFFTTEHQARKEVDAFKKTLLRQDPTPLNPFSIVKVETIPVTKAVLAELLSDLRRDTPKFVQAQEVIEAVA